MKNYAIFFLIISLLLISGCSTTAVENAVPETVYGGGETVKSEPEEKHTEITAVGDIMIGRGVGTRLKSAGYTQPFSTIKPYLSSDLLVGNLECVISDRGEKMDGKGIYLKARPESVETLKYLEFDALSLANNHTMDFGEDAFKDTMQILKENGISPFGAGMNAEEARTAYIKEINGIKIAVLAYNQFYNIKWSEDGRTMEALEGRCGTAPLDIAVIKEDIEKANETADIVIVMPHWGTEESTVVTEDQIKMAHEMIDAGADAVIGSHPHILQGIEVYNGGLIAYSMGNFVFDQNDSANKESIVLRLKFTNDRLDEAEITPFVIEDKVSPMPAVGEKVEEILGRLNRLSQFFGTVVVSKGDTGYVRVKESN